jgi:hypothetical protein
MLFSRSTEHTMAAQPGLTLSRPPSPSSLSSSTASLPSPQALTPTSAAPVPSPQQLPFAPTHVSANFATLEKLRDQLNEYAQKQGFRVREDNRDSARRSFRCWCFNEPKLTAAGKEARVYHADKGKVNCGCTWQVNAKKEADKAEFRITLVRAQHTGHVVRCPAELRHEEAKHLRQREDVPQGIENELRALVKHGAPGRSWAQQYLSGHHRVSFEDSLFRNMYRGAVAEGGFQPTDDDWRDAVTWGRSLGPDALVSISTHDATGQGRRLLFMSPAMTYNFRRNSEVIVMDTTHGTNRYRYHMLLLIGVSHYGHSAILASALLRNQQQEDFVWVFQQIQAFVGPAVWDGIRTVASDGDKALKAAISIVMPRVFHMRCVWHVQRNIVEKGTNRAGWMRGWPETEIDAFCAASNRVLFAQTEAEAKEALQQLYTAYPACSAYFDDNIVPNLGMFCAYALKSQVTFGMQTTQRSESMHALIKRDSKAFKPLTINTTMTELVTILHNVTQRHEVAAVEADSRARHRAEQQKQQSAVTGMASNVRPGQGIRARLLDVLTTFASGKCFDHYQAIPNYELREAEFVEDDGMDEWVCTARHSCGGTYTVSINRLDDDSQSSVMHCSCDMPANFLLPCSHVMAVNQHVFHQPVIMAQLGNRWKRGWQPSTFTGPTRPPLSSAAAATDGGAVIPDFVNPEEEAERAAVAWEMSGDEVYAIVDELLEVARGRPALMDSILVGVQELRVAVQHRSIGKFSAVAAADEAADAGLARLKNPQPRDSSKRQKRFRSRGEHYGMSVAGSFTQTQ